ncbi:MAG: maltose alpha-D-glucosyltransferase [Anaerolineae bacterium]|nr:maltose alpha-D-glucosyltransferase [Anaerolineae bacterium]
MWYKTATFYELYPRAYMDSNADGVGDFQGLLSRIDHLVDLGVGCVWITPYYPSPLRDDGYDISDFFSVYPDLGTIDDLKAVIDRLHEYNIKVVADLVMNHTSDQHPWFIESRSSRDNPKRDWYVWSDTPEKYSGTRVIFLDTHDSNWTYDEKTEQYYWHRFYDHQPDLNFDNPEVRAAMFEIMDFWLELGLDGFRADAVPYLFEREGTNCENLQATHDFLKEIRAHVDQKWPGRILLAEANQWPKDTREYFGDGDEFHMGFHFPVMPRLYMALKQKSRRSIVEIMNMTPEIPENAQWCIFLRNHDELTLEMVTAEEREYMWEQYAPERRMRLNLGIRRRLAPLMDNDRRRIELLNAELFTLPGSPILYYGDEIGMGDNIWLFDRNGVRTPMQWDASPNAGFSTSDPNQLYQPVIDDEVYGYQKVNVQAQRADPNSLYNTLKHMIRVRKQHETFGLGTFRFCLPDNEAVLAYLREYEGERILCVFNLSDQEETAHFDGLDCVGQTPVNILTDETLPPVQQNGYILTLAPYAYLWLKLG